VEFATQTSLFPTQRVEELNQIFSSVEAEREGGLIILRVSINLEKSIICNNFVTTKINIMEVSVIQIGNSKGIRFSKTILEKYNIKDKVDLILEKGKIIILPLSSPRKGWEDAFKEMNVNGDDRLLFDDVFEDETLEEWN